MKKETSHRGRRTFVNLGLWTRGRVTYSLSLPSPPRKGRAPSAEQPRGVPRAPGPPAALLGAAVPERCVSQPKPPARLSGEINCTGVGQASFAAHPQSGRRPLARRREKCRLLLQRQLPSGTAARPPCGSGRSGRDGAGSARPQRQEELPPVPPPGRSASPGAARPRGAHGGR